MHCFPCSRAANERDISHVCEANILPTETDDSDLTNQPTESLMCRHEMEKEREESGDPCGSCMFVAGGLCLKATFEGSAGNNFGDEDSPVE